MVRGPSGRHALPMNSTTTPPAPEPPVRRLHRSKTDRVIGGVAGGIAEYFRIDPVIVRVAAVALIVAGGAGVLLYLAALLLVPNDGEEGRAPGRGLTIAGRDPHRPRRRRSVLGQRRRLVLRARRACSASPGIFAWQLASGERADGDTRSLLRAAGLGGLVLVGCVLLALGAGWAAAIGGGAVVAAVVLGAGLALIASACRPAAALAHRPSAGPRPGGAGTAVRRRCREALAARRARRSTGLPRRARSSPTTTWARATSWWTCATPT